MKSCPTCNRTYPDDTLAFCLMDGSVLSAPYDPEEMPVRRKARVSAPRTEVLNQPGFPVDTDPTRRAPDTNSPLPSTVRDAIPPSRPLPANESQTHTNENAVPALTQWAFLVRGLLGIIFFVDAFMRTEIGPRHLFVVFSLYALIGGACMLIAAGKTMFDSRREWLIGIDGISGILFGWFAAVELPAPSNITALWMLATGIFQLITAVRFRKRARAWWLLALASVASILFGAVILPSRASPAHMPSFNAYLDAIKAFMLVSGVLLLIFGVRLRSQR